MFHIVPVAEASVLSLVKSIDKVVINPIILFMFACAMAYFLYGLVQYLLSPGNEEVHKKSKSIMLWGIIGLFIMVAVFGIMKLILSTFGENSIKINNNGDFVVDRMKVDPNNGTLINSDNSAQLQDRNGIDPKTGDLLPQNYTIKDSVTTIKITPEMFTSSPFPKYKPSSSCWNRVMFSKGSDSEDVLSLVKENARNQYLVENNILKTDPSKKSYPVIFATKVLYDEKANLYYAWIDIRAPKDDGTIVSSCTLEQVQNSTPILPDSIVFSQNTATVYEINQLGGDNIGEPNVENYIGDYTKSPFTSKFQESPYCWRKEIYVSAKSEYQALQDIKVKVREDYLSENNLDDKDTPANLPTPYGVLSAYDKVTKNYYIWWDARGPINGGSSSDCNLLNITPPQTLPNPSHRSAKTNPLKNTYTSDASFYRVVDSGTDSDYSTARSIAINNALIQIAKLKGYSRISQVIDKTILEERYYRKDALTGNFDYWVAIQAPK